MYLFTGPQQQIWQYPSYVELILKNIFGVIIIYVNRYTFYI